MPSLRTIMVSILLAGLSASTEAASVSLTPSQDNTLYQNATGALSNGLGNRLFVGRTGEVANYIRRAIMKFDVAAALPPGATVTGATLTVSIIQTLDTRARATGLHRVLAAWGEGSSTATGGFGGQGAGGPSTANSVTWVHRFYSGTPWGTPGGAFNASASTSTNMPTLGTATWTGAGLVSDVQDMLDNPGANHGWLLKGAEALPSTSRAIGAREQSVTTQRPTLTITFDAPVPVEESTWGEIKAGAAESR